MPDPTDTSPIDTRAIPLREEISKRAYQIWQSNGSPSGRSEEFWLEAEKQVLGADEEVRGVAGTSVRADNYAEATDANKAKARSGAK